MDTSSFKNDYENHLKNEHKINTLAVYLKEVMYGGNDGIITTFAVVAGFSGAELYTEAGLLGGTAVLLFGFANLFADAASMGLGNFLSLRSETELYLVNRKKEEYEIKHNRLFERKETIEILQSRGVSTEDAEKFVDLYERNPSFWADFMMDYELDMSDTRDNNPILNACATFGSFTFFGVIPLIPYFFEVSELTFYISILSTLVALMGLGVLRWYVIRQSWLRCIGETVLVGSVCAVIAYGVGILFR